MTVTPIVLQARMMQSAISFWQSMFVMQKQWFEAMTGTSFAPALTTPTAEPAQETPAVDAPEETPPEPAPLLRRRSAGA